MYISFGGMAGGRKAVRKYKEKSEGEREAVGGSVCIRRENSGKVEESRKIKAKEDAVMGQGWKKGRYWKRGGEQAE